MKLREKLNYPNVTATLALVVALGTGGAYAAGEIGSSEIENNSIRSADLKNRKAVAARDVRRDGLTGNQIKERTLAADQFAPLAGDQSGVCDPTDATFVECAAVTIDLESAGRLLLIASGDYFSEGGAASLNCRLAIDGVNESSGASPGEAASDNSDLIATSGFTRTRVTGKLGRGSHDVALRCAEPGAGDGRLAGASLSALGIAE